ncbi:hypothetical protein ACT9ST_08715 [Sphingobium limneticum]
MSLTLQLRCRCAIVFGVLRRTYADRLNNAAEFGRRKMQPIAPAGDPLSSPWRTTAERIDVVLPPGTDDSLVDAETILTRMDEHAVAHEKALLVYLTLPFENDDRLHMGWERCRDFARLIARERGLASVLVLHAPGSIGAPHPPHCHLLIVPRTTRFGLRYGVYDDELTCDSGQTVIDEMWRRHIASDPA